MALIDDLLSSYTAGSPTNDLLTIDRDTRVVAIPSTERIFGVLEDDNSETKYFAVDRNPTSSIDLATSTIYVSWEVTDEAEDVTNGYNEITEKAYNDTAMVFGWKIPSEACSKVGTIGFNVHFHGTNTQKWHSSKGYGVILDGYSLDGVPSADVNEDYQESLTLMGVTTNGETTE